MSDPAKSEASEFEYNGRTIGYVIRSGHGRCVRIVVSSAEEVEVRVPLRVSSRAAHAFVLQQADWILRAMDKQAKTPRVTPRRYVTGETVHYLGRPYRLEVVQSVWKRVTCEEGVLRVALYNAANASRVKALVEEWFRSQAQEALPPLFAETLERFGRQIRNAHCPLVLRSDERPDGLRLTVRTMKTRWGSCSKEGHITLGTELVHVPRRLIEYVMVHELSHLAHLNHSKAFYFQVAMCLPDWKERRQALEKRTWLKAQVHM